MWTGWWHAPEPSGWGGSEEKISDPSCNQIPIIQIPQNTHSTGKLKKRYVEFYMGFGHCTAKGTLTTIMTYVPIWQSFQWSLVGPSFLLLDVLDSVQYESTLECTDLLADNEVRLATECFLPVELWLQEDIRCLHMFLAVPPASYHHLSPFPSDKHKSRI